MLCAVPAFRALRARFPSARITLVGMPWSRDFASRFHRYVDDFLAFPGFSGLPEQPYDGAAFTAFVDGARARPFDLAIQMHGDGRVTNGVLARLGARQSTGFRPPGASSPANYLPYPAHGPEVRRLLALAAHLGAPARGEHLEFPLQAGDFEELERFAEARGLPSGRCICLHAGARAVERRWPAERFAAVGDALHEDYALPIVLTGAESERALTAAVKRAMRAPAFDAAGPVSAGALAAQLSLARVVVTNDTGVSHLAAALRVPAVIVFRASELERWAPLDRTLYRPVWDPAARLTEEVLAQARALLDATATAPAPAAAPLRG